VVRNLSSCLVFASQFFLPGSCLYIFLGKYGVGFTEQLRLVIMCCEVTPSDQISPVFVKVKQRLANHPTLMGCQVIGIPRRRFLRKDQ